MDSIETPHCESLHKRMQNTYQKKNMLQALNTKEIQGASGDLVTCIMTWN